MALFQMKWLRRFVRRHTNPISMNDAEMWKRRLSVGYMLVAWNAFGFVCYMIYSGRNDWAKYYGLKTEEDERMTAAEHYSKILNVEKGKIIRMSGFRKVDEAEFDNNKTKSS